MKQLLLVACILLLNFIHAQQLPQYSQWNTHQFALNPAHAGIKNCIDLQTLFRSQWVGLEGAPKSGFLTASFPIKTKRKKLLAARHGMGLKFENDRIGQMQSNRFNLAYAGHFNFSRENRLSLGLYGGVVQYGINNATVSTIDPDPTVAKEASFLRPDATFGAWWNSENYYLGLAVSNLIPYNWEIGQSARSTMHIMLNAGYRMSINEKFAVLPGIIFRQTFIAPTSLDMNLNVDFKNTFGIGIGYRNIDAVILTAYLKISQRFSIQYSYDITTSGLRNVSNGTHEVSIGFLNCRREVKGKTSCPLFE